LGIALAILLSVMMFTVFPLLQVGQVVLLQFRLNQSMIAGLNDDDAQALFMGGDFLGVSPVSLVAQTVLAGAFLGVAVGAWLGRPRRTIRVIMLGAVLLLTLLGMVSSVAALLNTPTIATGLDSGQSVERALTWGRLAGTLLVTMYVVWYLNRGPARAFYRGYYLPVETLPPS
jgi:hypothetical protein